MHMYLYLYLYSLSHSFCTKRMRRCSFVQRIQYPPNCILRVLEALPTFCVCLNAR